VSATGKLISTDINFSSWSLCTPTLQHNYPW